MINWQGTTLDVYIWDVGHGLSVTIITPFISTASGVSFNRRRVIQVDAGSNVSSGFSPIAHLVNNHKLSTIDWLILSHPDKDHIDDLPVIHALQMQQKLNVVTLMRNKTIPDSHISEVSTEELPPKTAYKHYNETYIAPVPTEDALSPANFGNVEVQTAYLPYMMNRDFNNASIVVSVKFGSVQLLVPGDLEEAGTRKLIDTGQMLQPNLGSFRILVAPHHGSSTASPGTLLKHYKPHKVLASVEVGHELSDPIYSSPDYVIGHPIELSSGITETRRFTGTKGESIHLQTYGHYPSIKKFSYMGNLSARLPSPLDAILKI